MALEAVPTLAAAWATALGRSRVPRVLPRTGRPSPLLPTRKACLQGFLHGRYWARTSDPQLVELVLSQLS